MQCANPLCHAESKYFRSGSLHSINYVDQTEMNDNRGQQRLIWLCGDCSRRFVVETWRPPGQQLRLHRPVVRGDQPHHEHSNAA